MVLMLIGARCSVVLARSVWGCLRMRFSASVIGCWVVVVRVMLVGWFVFGWSPVVGCDGGVG